MVLKTIINTNKFVLYILINNSTINNNNNM